MTEEAARNTLGGEVTQSLEKITTAQPRD